MSHFTYVMKTMYLHIKLLHVLGYEIDIKKGEYPIDEAISIYKEDELVGLLRIENQNLLDFKKNDVTICNMKLDKLNKKKEYKKHDKLLFHTFIKDEDFTFDCYNSLVTNNQRKNICLKNEDYTINYSLDNGISIETMKVMNNEKIKKIILRGGK